MVVNKPLWGFLEFEDIKEKLTDDQLLYLLTHAYCIACLHADPNNSSVYIGQAYANLWYSDQVGGENFLPNLYKYTHKETVTGIVPKAHLDENPVELDEKEFIKDLKTSIATGDAASFITIQGMMIPVELKEKRYDGWEFSFMDPHTGNRKILVDTENQYLQFK